MFLGILTLILFMVPQFIDKKLGVTIPVGLETVILIFIFSAEILGEINAFYVKIPVWDTILHTTNGLIYSTEVIDFQLRCPHTLWHFLHFVFQ